MFCYQEAERQFSPVDALCTSTLRLTQAVHICRRHSRQWTSQNIGSISRISLAFAWITCYWKSHHFKIQDIDSIAKQSLVGAEKQMHKMTNMIKLRMIKSSNHQKLIVFKGTWCIIRPQCILIMHNIWTASQIFPTLDLVHWQLIKAMTQIKLE